MTTPNGQNANPVLIQLQQQFEQLVAQNRADFEQLAKQGIKFDPFTLIMGQIESLYDTISEAMGPVQGPQFAVLVRLRWEQRIADNIANAKKEAGKAQLAVGGSLSPAQIRDLAKQTGTYGGLFR